MLNRLHVDNLFLIIDDQGRETKTKSTKKKYLRGKNDSEDEADDDVDTPAPSAASGTVDLDFMSVEEISDVLKGQESLADAPDELLQELATR